MVRCFSIKKLSQIANTYWNISCSIERKRISETGQHRGSASFWQTRMLFTGMKCNDHTYAVRKKAGKRVRKSVNHERKYPFRTCFHFHACHSGKKMENWNSDKIGIKSVITSSGDISSWKHYASALAHTSSLGQVARAHVPARSTTIMMNKMCIWMCLSVCIISSPTLPNLYRSQHTPFRASKNHLVNDFAFGLHNNAMNFFSNIQQSTANLTKCEEKNTNINRKWQIKKRTKKWGEALIEMEWREQWKCKITLENGQWQYVRTYSLFILHFFLVSFPPIRSLLYH